MKILFVIDRIELKYFEFNDLVTNFWLIKSFLERGHQVDITTIDMLKLKSASPYADTYKTNLKNNNIFYDKNSLSEVLIEEFQLVMFRPDPPVDLDYINATYIFDFVDRNKTVILNDTKAIRNFNEKLHAVMFNDLMPKNIVTSSKSDIIEFLNENEEIILKLKPLNQCFGGGVMYLKHGDKNTAVIINSMTHDGKQLIMVQKYIPQAQYGDKRVLILGDKVLPYCVQKIPSNDDFKFCEHKDILKAVLSEVEKENFEKVAKSLNKIGIYMAGLDVIDGKIIEVNVTSPCYFIREINNHFSCHVEDEISDYIISYVNDVHNRLKPLSIA